VAAGGLLAGVEPAPAGAPASALRDQLRIERVAHRRVAARYRHEIRRARAGLARLRAVAAAERRRVSEALTLASVVYGVSRHELEQVAYCEARFQPTARNGQYLGLFQLGSGFRSRSPFFSGAGLDPYSPYANAMAAARVVAKEGWRQWECRP
jgi:hypothetical protein